MMKSSAKDIFTALYEAFRKLDAIKSPDMPELTASNIEISVYEERIINANKEVENILEAGAKLLDEYVDNRIKKMIIKMKRE